MKKGRERTWISRIDYARTIHIYIIVMMLIQLLSIIQSPDACCREPDVSLGGLSSIWPTSGSGICMSS